MTSTAGHSQMDYTSSPPVRRLNQPTHASRVAYREPQLRNVSIAREMTTWWRGTA
jgi:hypothetical protein